MLKIEIRKFMSSSAILILFGVLYNSGYGSRSIFEAFLDFFKSIFEEPLSISMFVVAYLLFNVVYFLFYFGFKYFNLTWPVLLLTNLIIIFSLSMYFSNSALNRYLFKDFNWQRRNFRTNEKNIKIDKTNFKQFKWEMKAYDLSLTNMIISETLSFPNDSNIVITSWVIPGNHFCGIRYLLDFYEYEYSIKYVQKGDTLEIVNFYSEDNFVINPKIPFMIEDSSRIIIGEKTHLIQDFLWYQYVKSKNPLNN